MLFDQIILSCDENPVYREFWPVVSWAYQKLFPDVTVHLAFVTRRRHDDAMVQHMRQFGKVTIIHPIDDVPDGHQAKMARFILAADQGSDVCYIDDIDLIPLRREFIINAVKQRPANVLLCVGGEVYGFSGSYPISQMTAEGTLFRQMINPMMLTYPNLIRSWKDRAQFDDRENINIWPDMVGDRVDYYFSDERLLKRLIYENPVPKIEIKRAYDDFLDATIDRHTFDKNNDHWNFDRAKLEAGKYVNVHAVRPYGANAKHFTEILTYIEKTYDKR